MYKFNLFSPKKSVILIENIKYFQDNKLSHSLYLMVGKDVISISSPTLFNQSFFLVFAINIVIFKGIQIISVRETTHLSRVVLHSSTHI